MSFSATRLTCFALLAAIEDDMRSAIESAFGEDAVEDVLPADRVERAQARRAKTGLPPATGVPGLLPYLDFTDSYEALASRRKDLPSPVSEAVKSLAVHAARLVSIRNRVAHTRPMEIDDSTTLIDVAGLLRRLPGTEWPTVTDTLARLEADPSYVLGLTISLPKDPDTAPQNNLPVPDFDETGFFGRQDQLLRIKKAIKGAYPVVSILGDGGIGKTSIALKAAYELLEDPTRPFEAIVWVTAKATILTTNEIQRISGAIESSLGLFAAAADELASGSIVDDPVAEVLSYLEHFRILLILDNLETVLDQRLRNFLLDLPMGSKVLVTSRIGLGIENPVQLAPLSSDESERLLRTLVRVRNVNALKQLTPEAFSQIANKMGGHPAYIRWFVAGVQAGRRPEELLTDNGLLLDFCMSNVYKFLKDDARSVVRSMQMLPGARNQAELAFLNDFSAGRVQAALLELITTNFVQMSSQASAQTLDTVYQLSDFGRQYLEKHHPVEPAERSRLLDRSYELRDLGSQLTAATAASPFAAETVNVRGVGDVTVARLLREAIRDAQEGSLSSALQLCSEAQVLSPTYYEAWRVEAYVRALTKDHQSAVAAHERAIELAPESAVVRFHYGTFLLNEVGDPRRALELLQAAARIDAESAGVVGQIAWAHYCLGDIAAAVDTCNHLMSMKSANQSELQASAVVALRAATHGIREYASMDSIADCIELLEAAVQFATRATGQTLTGEALDRLLHLETLAQSAQEKASDDYLASKAAEYAEALRRRRVSVDVTAADRTVGPVKAVKSEKGFAFVASGGTDYFFHYRGLVDASDWERLTEGSVCAFDTESTERGPRAIRVRLLD